jgi:hypothetical protein
MRYKALAYGSGLPNPAGTGYLNATADVACDGWQVETVVQTRKTIRAVDGSSDNDAGIIQHGDSNNDMVQLMYGRKFGFYGVTPVVKAAHITDATGAADVITRCNAILVVLENLGLVATS